MEKTKRNYGIDLLRIFCMFLVVILHILGHGKVLETSNSSLGFSVSWFLEIAAYPAVNCFVMISGFVGYREGKYYSKLNNLFSLLFTALFYSVIITLSLKFIIHYPIGKIDLIKAFLPVTTSRYWFFTAYFAMFLISPALNLFVHRANEKMLLIASLTVLVFCFYSVIIDPFLYDPFKLQGGYTFMWFAFIYVLGAIIKKCNIVNKVSSRFLLALLFISLFLTWLAKVAFHFIGHSFSRFQDTLVSYCSPTTLIVAICLLCLFAKLKINKLQKVIAFFASSAFSVYLIHDNFYIREILVKGNFAFFNNLNVALLPILVILSALAIFVICSLIDKVRIFLFDVCKVKKLCEKLETVVKSVINSVYIKIQSI